MYSYAAYPQSYHLDSLHNQDEPPVVDSVYSASPSQDLAPNFTTSFSRGSPYVYSHHPYYLVDRGELDSQLCPTSIVSSTLGATGIGFSGDPSSVTFTPQVAVPEDISAYVHHPHTHSNDWDSWPTSTIPGPSSEPSSSSSVIVAPAPVYAAPSSFSGSPFNHGGASCHPPLEKDVCGSGSQDVNGACSLSSTVTAPTQLPTPAAIAALLSPNARTNAQPQQGSQANLRSPLSAFEIAPGAAGSTSDMIVPLRASPSVVRAPRPVEPRSAVQAVPEAQSREKKHACTMCHKRFDRPSTLRKHLLVHTGEKAYLCETCGRRFGVASNLNRHVKRCLLKPGNNSPPGSKSATNPAQPILASSSPSASSQPPTTTVPLVMPPKDANASKSSLSGQPKRGRNPTPTGASPSDSSSASQSSSSSNVENTENNNAVDSAAASTASPDKGKSPGQKRRRRAPSPSSWVPDTLRDFNLASEALLHSCPVPLPPVRRNLPKEERDSWDENVAATPYHPNGWKGVLPGPGLAHHHGISVKNVQNFNYGGRGGYTVGRVMRVF